MSQRWQAAAQAAVSTDANALNWLPTDAHLLTLHADRRRDAATRTRNRYRIVLNNYANALPSLRDRATQMIGYMTMVVQNADWLDTIAEKLENAARSPRPAAGIWETLTWTSEFFP